MTDRDRAAVEAAKKKAREWNDLDAQTQIPAEAAKQIALAALAGAGEMPAKPVDGNHALMIGSIHGIMLVAVGRGVEPPLEVEARPLIAYDGSGDYLDTFRVARASGTYLISVKKEAD